MSPRLFRLLSSARSPLSFENRSLSDLAVNTIPARSQKFCPTLRTLEPSCSDGCSRRFSFPIPLVSLFGIHPDTSLGSPGNALRSARLRLLSFPSLRITVVVFFREATLRDSRNDDQPGVSPGTVYGSQATTNGPGFTDSSDFRAAVSPLTSLPAFCRAIPTAGL